LVLTAKYKIGEASRAMDVSYSEIRKWVKQLEQEKSGITPMAKAITPEHLNTKRFKPLGPGLAALQWRQIY